MKEQEILRMDFSHFPTDERSAQIPNKVFLIDNLGEPTKESPQEIMAVPVQATMNLSVVCVRGTISVRLNRRNITLHQGDALNILPGAFFQFVSTSDNCEMMCMAVAQGFADLVVDVKVGLNFRDHIVRQPVYKMRYDEMSETIHIYKAMKRNLYDPNYKLKEEMAKGYLRIIMCNAFNNFMNNNDIETVQKSNSRREEIFMQFIVEVQHNYKKEREVTFYADKLCMSAKYLSSVVHEVSDKYASEWINEFVVLEAKKLLKNRYKTIKDVCNDLNFSNQSFFAKYFKQHTGYTPKEFKNL